MKKNLLLLFIVALSVSSCSSDKVDELLKGFVKAPPSSIERVVVGHDQVYSIQAILRMSRKSDIRLENGDNVYTAYDIAHFETPIPVYQEITISRDERGNSVITSDRKAFDVLKSDVFYYGLELNYFDINGNNINHQFAQISDPAESKSTKREECKTSPEATLYQHQHFFTIGNSALGYHAKGGKVEGKLPLVYPMTRDSLYIDRYLFPEKGGEEGAVEIIRAESTSGNPIYTPLNKYVPNGLRYQLSLALRAQETLNTDDYVDASGHHYQLTQTIAPSRSNELVPEIFTYEYRDTDPMDKMLGEEVDFDDLGDNRGFVIDGYEAPYTIRMRMNRALGGDQLERLGFKGMLQFRRANVHFQMHVSIFHIKNARIGKNGLGGKYDDGEGSLAKVKYKSNELNTSLGDFDSQLTIPFRVMADVDNNDQEQCISNVKLYYPNANEAELRKMLWSPDSYFSHYPSKNM